MADILSIGITGLSAAKKALETTGHNISNSNTEGYTRQKVDLTTNIPQIKQGLVQGTGVRVNGISRINDPFVEKRLNSSISKNKYFQERFQQLSQVENIFNEIDTEGLNQVLNRFYNSFRELANRPEDETMRSLVRDNARLVINDFKRIRETLDELANGIDKKTASDIETVNKSIEKIADLNQRILVLESNGDETGDFRDQREKHLRTLSEYFEIHHYADEKGRFIVNAVGVGTVVTGREMQKFTTANLPKEDSTNNMPGSGDIFFEGRFSSAVSGRFRSGKIASMVKLKNEDLKQMQDSIDGVAFEFMNTVNAIHRRGYVNRTIPQDKEGGVPLEDQKGLTTNINFFEGLKVKEGAAKNLSLSKEVIKDISNIATALSPNSPGDNRISLAISKLQHEKVMAEGTATLEEEFLQMVGGIGLETSKAKLDSEQSEGIHAQMNSIKERISGVSIDEETANLVKFQHAYEASARVMQTANEMFETVLSLKK